MGRVIRKSDAVCLGGPFDGQPCCTDAEELCVPTANDPRTYAHYRKNAAGDYAFVATYTADQLAKVLT